MGEGGKRERDGDKYRDRQIDREGREREEQRGKES